MLFHQNWETQTRPTIVKILLNGRPEDLAKTLFIHPAGSLDEV